MNKPFFERRIQKQADKQVTTTKHSSSQKLNEYFIFINESLKHKPLYKVKEEMNKIGGW
jgi:hypothetical protein